MKVCSFNILCGGSVWDDGTDYEWWTRAPSVVELINKYSPDILGVQEAHFKWITTLNEGLNGYDYIGVGRDDGKQEGEFSAIFYKKDKFELIDSSTFWLSETPTQPSKGWDAACRRVCTFGVFTEKASGKKFIAMNTHLDHRGDEARRQGSVLIAKAAEIIGEKYSESFRLPTFLSGDFNSTNGLFGLNNDNPCDAYKTMLSAGFEDSRVQSGSDDKVLTYNGFGRQECNPDMIDFIFTRDGAVAKSYRAITDKCGEKYISDHYPIIVDMEI